MTSATAPRPAPATEDATGRSPRAPEARGTARLTGPRLERLAGTPVTARDLRVLTTLDEKWGA